MENWTDLSDARRAALLADILRFLQERGLKDEQVLNIYEWGSKVRRWMNN